MKQVKIPSYGKIYAVGHAALGEGFYDHDLRVEEKVDGSQISFGNIGGELAMRSNRQEFDPYAPVEMFANGADVALQLFKAGLLPEGVAFRGEYLQKPRHNVLSYDRTPRNHIILFDAFDAASGKLYSREELEDWARRFNLEVVPWFGTVRSPTFDDLKQFLENESVLGGQKIEGVVLKPTVTIWGRDGKAMNGKYVSEKFKEKHAKESYGPQKKADLLMELADIYRTEARWEKAVQHLREEGELENQPRDIGKLMPEIVRDTLDECEDEIKDFIWKRYSKDFRRVIGRGFPEWYKEKIAREQLDAA